MEVPWMRTRMISYIIANYMAIAHTTYFTPCITHDASNTQVGKLNNLAV